MENTDCGTLWSTIIFMHLGILDSPSSSMIVRGTAGPTETPGSGVWMLISRSKCSSSSTISSSTSVILRHTLLKPGCSVNGLSRETLPMKVENILNHILGVRYYLNCVMRVHSFTDLLKLPLTNQELVKERLL